MKLTSNRFYKGANENIFPQPFAELFAVWFVVNINSLALQFFDLMLRKIF